MSERQKLRLTVQEHKLPGESLIEKSDLARRLGFDAVVLRSKGRPGHFDFADRLTELERAKAAGVIMPVACVDMKYFIGDADPDEREDALLHLKSQLSVMAAIGGSGVVTPSSYGKGSLRLPNGRGVFGPRVPLDEHMKIMQDQLAELSSHAESTGTDVKIFLEPLNGYETDGVTKLEQAEALRKQVGSPAFKIAADTYHIAMEETSPYQAITEHHEGIGWFDIGENNRYQPEFGIYNWQEMLRTIQGTGYDGYLGLEGRLFGDNGIAAMGRVATFMQEQYAKMLQTTD